MDIKERIDELHAKEVTPEVFEEVWGESKEEAKRKVMDFVERFLQAKTERDQKKHKRATRTEQKAVAAIELDPAALPAAAKPAAAERASRRRSAKQDVGQTKDRATRIVEEMARQFQTERLVAPQIQIGRAAKTIGEIKKVKLDNGIIIKAAIKGTKGKVGKATGGRMPKGPRGPKGV